MPARTPMLRPRKLDIFIAKQFAMLFAGTFFICQFVLMMQFLWRYVDVLIGKGLSVDVLGQFFWYMALMLVPQALPLAILLSSLIAYGNLGESSELTAIKAAGISLLQSFRSVLVASVAVAFASFYFQNNIGPDANAKLTQLLLSMKQKSPELEIPEGVFYDGIPNCNLYVQQKDLATGKLYGIMIYRMTGSYEDQAIILADSGMLQSTAEKKHLLLTLWSGEWFENMREQELAGSAAVPYRRESFVHKRIVLDYDGDFSLTDAAALSGNAKGKSLEQISTGVDSINAAYDSIGRVFYADTKRMYYNMPKASAADSAKAVKEGRLPRNDFDSSYAKLPVERKKAAVNRALDAVQGELGDLAFKAMVTKDGDTVLRMHYIEAINKFTLALSCIIFLFIGAPLGALLRKGGLGVPVIVSVLVFIVYYILDNTGYRMARQGLWSVWFGKGLATAVLAPAAVYVTYKANNDSLFFNVDTIVDFLRRFVGLRVKRHMSVKEVIITPPQYGHDLERLAQINSDVRMYEKEHRLSSAPNYVRVFFKYRPDHGIERICADLEEVIGDLSNTTDKAVMAELNSYPVVSTKAHTRPFDRKWLNVAAGVLLPLGAVLYVRMWLFRVRLQRDLRTLRQVNHNVARLAAGM